MLGVRQEHYKTDPKAWPKAWPKTLCGAKPWCGETEYYRFLHWGLCGEVKEGEVLYRIELY